MKFKKKKQRLIRRPLRLAAVILSAMTLLMIVRFPEQAVNVEGQRERLNEAAELYYDVQAKNNRLNAEIAKIDTDDFVEQTARREYGYCWYGETIYEVINLEEIQEQFELEVYDGE